MTDYLLWSRELEAEACFRAGDYSGAIRITRDLIAWYGRLTRQQRAGTEVEEDRNLNFRQAQNHISLARLYALNGETAQAAGAYAEAQRLLANTDKVLSPQMHELALDYLKAAGRYPEALRRAWQYLDEARVGDTVNLFNLAAKRQLSDIYRHLGDYPHAWNMEHQAAVLAFMHGQTTRPPSNCGPYTKRPNSRRRYCGSRLRSPASGRLQGYY